MEKEIRCEDDDLTHVYTLMLFPNLTYKVSIDLQVVQEGYLEDDWRFLVDKVIRDPTAKKPDNWDMREMIFDENDTKPEDWDKPETILDPNAVKPDNWNDEMDGEWQPPEIPNPEYKGKWKRRLIKNPNYHGPWRAPFIQNPDYVPDAYLVSHHDIGAVGFEIWQVKSGTIFDNILITDDPVFAEKVGNNTWRKSLDLERLRRDEYVDIEKKRQQGAEESNKQQGEALSGASERKHDGKGSKAIAMEEL
uniref:Calreticulin n=1 Tax=Trichuris muris TaxID=70415 RepID=A0A5S6QUB6_TRIMR